MIHVSNRFRAIFSMLLLMCLSACGYLIQPKVAHQVIQMHAGAFQIDPTHTTLLFKVNHLGLSTFVGRFNKVDASLDFDPQNMANSKLSAVIDINSLDINNPALTTTLLDSDWFDAPVYPKASFITRSVKLIDSQHAEYSGDFDFHGVTKPITLAVEFKGAGENLLTGNYTLGFEAHAKIKRSEFGMGYLVPAISDWVEIDVFAEFKKK